VPLQPSPLRLPLCLPSHWCATPAPSLAPPFPCALLAACREWGCNGGCKRCLYAAPHVAAPHRLVHAPSRWCPPFLHALLAACRAGGAKGGGRHTHLPRWRAAPTLCTPPPPGLPMYPIRHMQEGGNQGRGACKNGEGVRTTPFVPPLRGTEGQGDMQTEQGDPARMGGGPAPPFLSPQLRTNQGGARD